MSSNYKNIHYDNLLRYLDKRGIELVKPLGEGGQGRTFLVKDSRGKFACLKLVGKVSFETFIYEGDFKNLDLLVTSYKTFYEPKLETHFVFSNYILGDLLSTIMLRVDERVQRWKKDMSLLKNNQIRGGLQIFKLVDSILRSCVYLERLKISHCDLKPDNIIIRDGKVYIIDFGMAKEKTLMQTGGTIAFLPPESFFGMDHAKKYLRCEKAERWSLGLNLFQLITSSNFYRQEYFKDRVYMTNIKYTCMLEDIITTHVVNMSYPLFLQNFFIKILKKLLHPAPNKRDSFTNCWLESQKIISSVTKIQREWRRILSDNRKIRKEYMEKNFGDSLMYMCKGNPNGLPGPYLREFIFPELLSRVEEFQSRCSAKYRRDSSIPPPECKK